MCCGELLYGEWLASGQCIWFVLVGVGRCRLMSKRENECRQAEWVVVVLERMVALELKMEHNSGAGKSVSR